MLKNFLIFSKIVILCVLIFKPVFSKTATGTIDFQTWLEKFKLEAISRNISKSTILRTFEGVKPIARVIELDRHQSEFILSLGKYLSRSVTKSRITQGRKLLKKNTTLLNRIAAKYKVQPRFLVSFWGLETNFGSYTGVFPVVSALVTLAHDRRRPKFFRKQLFALLELIEEGHIDHKVKGSWAGAMGNHQFIPTTYRDFANDFDGDGKVDLWGSKPDTFASAANYLNKVGWDQNRNWGRQVSLPNNFSYQLTGLNIQKKLSDWSKLGVVRADGSKLPLADITASLILPAGYKGPAFLVYKNFRKILIWNRSIFYALAVGILADKIDGRKGLETIALPAIPNYSISRKQIMTMQRKLTLKGFNTHGIDGKLGPKTRQAIRSFQKELNLPQDGFPTISLLQYLKKN